MVMMLELLIWNVSFNIFLFLFLRMAKRQLIDDVVSSAEESEVEETVLNIDDVLAEGQLTTPVSKRRKGGRSPSPPPPPSKRLRAHRQRMLERKAQVGSKSMISRNYESEFDFDQIGLENCQDSARQKVIKKQHFPRQLLCLVKTAKRVSFQEKHGSDLEIMLELQMLTDLTNQKMVRDGINYRDTTLKFVLPNRFQEQLKNLIDLARLTGSLFMIPNHDPEKWITKKDKEERDDVKRDGASVPVFLVVPSKQTLHELGLTTETFPTVVEMIEQAEKINRSEEEGSTSEGCTNEYYKGLVEYFTNRDRQFYMQETHKSNGMK